MPEDITTPVSEAAFVEAPAVEAVAPGNCTGELVQLPDVPGTTFHSYECATCHQIVNVGMEELEANGLPPEHAVLVLEHA